MKNSERYEKQITTLRNRLAVKDGKPAICDEIDCIECDINAFIDG